MDNEIADSKDAKTTNIAPVLYHRIINVNPMQLNRADAEQMLAAYTPYVSEVINSIVIPIITMAIFIVSANFINVARTEYIFLSAILISFLITFIAKCYRVQCFW